MTPAQYQQEFNNNARAGRELVYLNAYRHRNGPRFTAIWHQNGAVSTSARHGMTGPQL